MKFLADWLLYIKSLHVKQIDLGLSRVAQVAMRMDLLTPSHKVITVAGTNGKGSTVAGLEAIYVESGFRIGAFTSPFLFRFNEQIRINGQDISDDDLCRAFAAVENARQNITLTPFEFNTLAALDIFQKSNLDICILEVGLGGRLDAVNIIDADVAIVTSIDIDHADWLGDTREKIAHEKAGIFRARKPAICGDFNPPQTLIDDANALKSVLYCQNKNFGFQTDGFSWNWWNETTRYEKLPLPSLLLQNMSCVLMAVELLQSSLPIKREAIDKALQNVSLTGRIQIIPGEVVTIYDVSHNPASVALLCDYLNKHPIQGKTHAVFSMLVDKDISATLSGIKNEIDNWYVAPLQCERAASKDLLMQNFLTIQIDNIIWFDFIIKANNFAKKQAKMGDRIVVFGSFHTVAECLS